ncbi:MAG: hypothetical protein ACTS8Y_04300 [Arsenophonus sp. ER-EMS1-MAG3]
MDTQTTCSKRITRARVHARTLIHKHKHCYCNGFLCSLISILNKITVHFFYFVIFFTSLDNGINCFLYFIIEVAILIVFAASGIAHHKLWRVRSRYYTYQCVK